MAKQIIILERVNAPSDLSFSYVLWAAVPAARQSFYANATATSAYTQASAAELTALQTGAVVELVRQKNFPAGTPIATMQAALIAEWTAFQNLITNQNRFARYGSFWDGSTWTLQGVA